SLHTVRRVPSGPRAASVTRATRERRGSPRHVQRWIGHDHGRSNFHGVTVSNDWPGSPSGARPVRVEQRPKHDHWILIVSIVLPYRPGNDTQFFEAKPIPEMAREHIF